MGTVNNRRQASSDRFAVVIHDLPGQYLVGGQNHDPPEVMLFSIAQGQESATERVAGI